MRVAVITASTPIYRGQEEDASGKVIRHILEGSRTRYRISKSTSM